MEVQTLQSTNKLWKLKITHNGLVQYGISVQMHLKLKSCKVSFSHNLLCCCPIWNFAQSTAVMLPCSVQNIQNNLIIETDLMVKLDFARFEFKMGFWQISYIAKGRQAHVFLELRINTLRPRKIDAISQMTFSKGFSWTKVFAFWLKFHWSLFPRVQLTKFQHWFRW